MANEYGLSCFDDLTLHFESASWIHVINYPHAIEIGSCRRNACQLLNRDGGTHRCAVLIACKLQLLSEQVLVCLDSHFLPIPKVVIGAEEVGLLHSDKLEHGPGHWPRVLPFASGGDLVGLLDVRNSISDVHDHPALGLCVLDHYFRAPLEEPIA